MRNKVILLISPEAWGSNYVSKHHYAHYLSQDNTVYFLNPPKSFVKNPFTGVNCKLTKITNTLITVDYLNLLPRLNNLPSSLKENTYLKQAMRIQKAIGITEFDIIWNFDPNRFANQKVWQANKYIYHTVDVHSSSSPEALCCTSADIVLLSSEMLRENLAPYSDNINYIGHGADIAHFENVQKEELKLPGKQAVKAGLIANYNNNIDYDLIEQIALENSTIDFIFVGPYEDGNLGGNAAFIKNRVKELMQQPNIYFIGTVASKALISWMQAFDINLVLYREDRRDIIINPHKMMGYFYAGKITVASWFNEYKGAENDFIYMTTENKAIPKVIKEVATQLQHYNSQPLMKKRKAFAESNSYRLKIEKINALLYGNTTINN